MELRVVRKKKKRFKRRFQKAIPKENVLLGGILGTYCEVIDDAKITFPEIEYSDFYESWIVKRTISVQISFKEDLSESYKRQAKEFLNGFDEKEYGIECYDGLESSFGRPYGSTRSTDLFSAKKGSVIALTGSFIAKEARSKSNAKKTLNEMANNPLYTVTLSIAPILHLKQGSKYIKEIPLQ